MLFYILLVLNVPLGCLAYINDFSIDVRFPGFRNTTIRSFIIDSTSADDFIWQAKGFADLAGFENTYNESASRRYWPGQWLYKKKFFDGKRYCDLDGMMAIDDMALLRYKDSSSHFGVVQNTSCGANVLRRSTTFNGHLRAGRLSLVKRQYYLRTNLNKLVASFKVGQICLHITVTDDLKIKQTSVVVGARLAENRTIGSHLSYKDPYWQIPTKTFKVGEKEFKMVTYYKDATINTAYDKIRIPYLFFDEIAKVVDAVYINETAKWMVDCDKHVDLEIGLANMKFKIRFDALLRRETPQDKRCELLLERNPTRDREDFTLGVPFFVNNGVCFEGGWNTLTFYDASYDPSSPIFHNTWGTYVSIREE